MSLSIFCLLVQSISIKEELKSSTIIVDSSVLLCFSLSFHITYLNTVFLGAHMLSIVFFSNLFGSVRN
jgi:hypothetical protein